MEISSRPARYFSVSTRKLVLMSLTTFGIYEIYWFYKNWKLVKATEKKDLLPFVNAIFLIFTAHPLFKRVVRDAKENGYEHVQNAGTLALTFIGLTLCGSISGRGDSLLHSILFLISFLTIMPLIDIQRAINFVNQKDNPNYMPSDKFSALDILIIVIGACLTMLTLIGSSWAI